MPECRSFSLTEDMAPAIALGLRVARRLLAHAQITPRQVVGLGSGLYALERLPLSTPGVACEFGIEYRFGDAEFNEYKYISFSISEELYRIFRGGSVYERSVGGDTFSEPGWYIDINGDWDSEGDLMEIEAQFNELLSLGAQISVSDESAIEWDS